MEERRTPPLPPERPVRPKTRRRPWLAVLTAVIVLAIAALCCVRFVHIWSEPTCEIGPRCRICGLEQGESLGHSWDSGSCETAAVCSRCGLQSQSAGHMWTEESCTEYRSCSVCGAVSGELREHTWSGGVCTACGLEQPNGILRWADHSCQSEYRYDPETYTLYVRAPGAEDFAECTIELLDSGDNIVIVYRHTRMEESGERALSLIRDLPAGRYALRCDNYWDTKIATFYYGVPEVFLPVSPSGSFFYRYIQSREHGLWMEKDSQTALRGVPNQGEAAEFDSNSRICEVAENGNEAIPIYTDSVGSTLAVDEYLRFAADGSAELAYGLRYEKWNLAMDSTGRVYFTDTFSEDCLWFLYD